MRYTRAAPGIYQDARTGNYYERPTIGGQRTWRRLLGRTLKLAKEELAARRTDQKRASQGFARDPYAPAAKTVGELCVEFLKLDCPDRRHHARTGKQLEQETYRIKTLFPFWSKRMADGVKPRDCAQYFAWRKKQVKRGDGGRTVDMELGTLSSIFQWAVATGRMDANPLFHGRPRFRNTKLIRHCREMMPIDGNELHSLAAHLFESRQSEVLGWQLLLEAMTGCRTSEILKLRWDARHMGEPGFIDGETLWIARSKGGVKPFVSIHPALAECIEALKRWRLWRYPKSQWWLPSRVKGLPVALCSLTHALKRAGPLICQAHRTSHGLRAFYVTVRRSEGISDAQIADEIGDKSGAAIVVSTYGAVPPNWRGNEAISWMPTQGKPAWTVLGMPENLLPIEAITNAG